MPNWCNNSVEIYHEDPAMIERVREAFNKGALLQEFIPVPESLHIVSGRVGDDTDPKQIELKEAETRNLATHGYATWYDFCVNEWGTKWDVGADGNPAQDIPGGLMLGFDSAWSPPTTAYEKLMEQGFTIRAMYYESGMAFAGIWEDGNDDYYEFGSMSSTEIVEELPEELDEAFGISESAAEWEEENAEDEENIDIDLDGGVSAVNEQEQQK
jgi:hypothetical protein